MMSLKSGCYLFALTAGLILTGCATSNDARNSSNQGSSATVRNTDLTLADYLRRLSGVIVQGSGDNARVFIQGAFSAEGNSEPLFVVDGQRVGSSFSAVSNVVDVNDIDRVEVLKGSKASSAYGIAGSKGVIVIYTKRG